MPNATVLRTHFLDTTDQTKSIAVVEVNGVEMYIPFWYSAFSIWTKEEVKEFLCAEALRDAGYIEDAHDLLKSNAYGSLIIDEENKYIDTRNWRQNWIDSYPIPENKTFIDPLL